MCVCVCVCVCDRGINLYLTIRLRFKGQWFNYKTIVDASRYLFQFMFYIYEYKQLRFEALKMQLKIVFL